MFSIGLEFSLPQFRAMRRLVLEPGHGAVSAVTAFVRRHRAGACADLSSAIVLASALAMSSTAIGIRSCWRSATNFRRQSPNR